MPMKCAQTKGKRMRRITQAVRVEDVSGPVWDGDKYARIPPGIYQGICTGWQGPDWVIPFQRWSLRLNFALLDGETEVSAFLNMGNDPKQKSYGTRSKFYAAWCCANGERPRKGQRLRYDTFAEPGLLYTLRVADAIKDERQADKPDALVYSKVVDIVGVDRR